MRRLLVAVVTALTLVAAGCASSGTPSPSTSGGGAQSSAPQASSGAGGPAAELTAEEAVEDIETARRVVDAYWQTHWNEMFTGQYRAPAFYGLYDGTDPSTAPVCQLPSGPQTLGPKNAYHCPDVRGNFLAFDVEFMSQAFEIGDTFLYLIVAHEWGHAIAYLLNDELQAQSGELQADCLAGAALYGAVRDGTLVLEENDEREITRGLTDIADETAWTNTQDHGDPFERIDAFNSGRTNGPLACLPQS